MKCLHFFALLILLSLNITLYSQNDKEFWFVAPDITHLHGDDPLIIRVTAFDKDAEVSVSMPANANFKKQTEKVSKNSQFSFVVKKTDVENLPVDKVNNKGLFIESTENVSVYYEVANQGNPDKFTLKGENALGKEFFVVSQDDYQNWPGYNGEANEKADIVATEDNTIVTIIPKVNVTGHKAGVPYTINLNKGQTYCIEYRDISHKASLAGTYIKADKNIAVTISDDSVNESSHPHDLIGDQMIPTSVIGYEYIAVKTSDQTNATQKVYVLATEDNTHIFIDGDNSKVASLNKGELKSFHITNHAIHIRGTKPIYAYQLCGLVNVHGNGTANELGSALLPTIECTGSSFVSFTRIFARLFWVQILAKEKDLNHFIMRDENNNVVDDISNLSWHKVAGTDSGDSDDTWYSAIIDLNITTGVPYTIQNTNGLFHLSVLDENDPSSGPGSVSYGYFSSYGRMKLQGPTQECVGNAIELSASAPMDTYHWHSEASNGAVISTDPTIQVTESGRYWLTAETQLGGCEITDSIDVDFMLPEVDLGDDVEVCPGETVTLTTQAGYQNYNWSNNATGNSTTVTTSVGSSETISVEVTDELGCMNSDDVLVEALPLPLITLDKTSVCAGQVVTNTSLAEKYEWEFEGRILNSDLTQNFIIPERSGDYTIRVWNAEGCMASQVFTITVNALPVIASLDQILCDGEAGTFTAPTGTGYTYLWHDGSTASSFVLSSPGNVSLTVIDNLGCEASGQGSLSWYAPSSIDLGEDREECAGVSLEIEEPNLYSNYQWSFIKEGTTNEVILPTPSPEHIYEIVNSGSDNNGNYIVNALDNNGCPVSDGVNVAFTNTPAPTITPDRNLCQGNTVELVASGGYDSYVWYKDGVDMNVSSNQNRVTSTGAGSYIVEATFAGCSKRTEVDVIEYANPSVTLVNDFNICDGSSVDIEVSNFTDGDAVFDYLVWSNGVRENDYNTASMRVNVAGDFSVTAYDKNGCSDTDQVTTSMVSPVNVDLGNDIPSCLGTSVTLTNPVSPVNSYKWFKVEATGDIEVADNSDYITNVAGTYLLKVEDINGCEAQDDIVLSSLPLPVLSLGDDVDFCGASYTIEVDDLYNAYEWNNDPLLNTHQLEVVTSGTNTLKVTDLNGCEASDDIDVTLNQLPVVTLDYTQACAGEDMYLSVNGSASNTYSWSTGESTTSIKVNPGTYWLDAINIEGCTTRVQERVNWFPVPKVSLGPDAIVCPMLSLEELDAGSGYASYLWHTGARTQVIYPTILDTVNMVTVRDGNGCSGFATKSVKHKAYEGPKLISDTTVCEFEIIELDAGPDFISYRWNDGDESQLKTVEEAGQYIVEVSDECYIHTDTANIVHYESPVIARLDTSIYAQVVVFAEGGRIPYTYSLNDGFPQNENVFKSLENGDYTVYVIDRNGCTAENAFSMNNAFDVEVPPFFTPNNDGINDRWEIDGIDRFPDSIIKIYDRYGKLLIKYKASAPGWDGRYLGQPVKTDDYWYVVELVEVKKALKGHFTLKR
ncbi:T9SS type B sorting domain-containing protein [Saccharicrinis aurantiacus]|uniref:T9SS type B sorting domain-containing protein n=1 Tax=Saccharicrinis aurantiacus TaxID=1849719 RepID=UPI002490351B|nr:T9SS type B sorting domain-containing protein [Saccharicrinis aurantiacus]